MTRVTIIDSSGVEKSSSNVTELIPLDILEQAAAVTCEVWNRDHPSDGWKVKIVKDQKA